MKYRNLSKNRKSYCEKADSKQLYLVTDSILGQAPSKGFSLLEILVAFTILALSLSILLKIFSSGVNTAFVAEEYTAAVQIAESLMVAVGVEDELQIAETSGIKNEKYRWRTQVSEINNPVTQQEDLTIEFLHVNVSVSWDDATRQARMVELNSIIPRHKKQ